MALKRSKRLEISSSEPIEVFNPSEIVDRMIELRCQLAKLERQDLQPAFFAACLALNTDTIALERAVISRRLTPGRWLYSPDIIEGEGLIKQLKREFQQTHEPSGGREVTWFIKLLLLTA
jgi:hypothetical protein